MRHLAPATFLLLSAAPAMADMMMVGDLHIEQPMLRETPPNAPVGAGYLTIVNTGDRDDVLMSATIAGDVAAEVQLHEMSMADGVMTMKALEAGIPLPAGQTVTLAPGGYHMMITGLEQPLRAGETLEATLRFEQAGEIMLDMPVMTLGEIRAATEGAQAMEHFSNGHGSAAHAPAGN